MNPLIEIVEGLRLCGVDIRSVTEAAGSHEPICVLYVGAEQPGEALRADSRAHRRFLPPTSRRRILCARPAHGGRTLSQATQPARLRPALNLGVRRACIPSVKLATASSLPIGLRAPCPPGAGFATNGERSPVLRKLFRFLQNQFAVQHDKLPCSFDETDAQPPTTDAGRSAVALRRRPVGARSPAPVFLRRQARSSSRRTPPA